MCLNDPIGGYFELETNDLNSTYHNNAIAVNSARNALEYILLLSNYKIIHIPYYTCDVILQPIKRLNIDYEFYFLDSEFFPIISSLKNDEAILYVNYFGLMNSVISSLSLKFKNLIIDNAQAFYSKPLKGISTIYSPRKFFGLPDGGFLYQYDGKLLSLEFDKSYDRISHLIGRVENGVEESYHLFNENETQFENLPLRKMSKLTNKLMRNIDFDLVLQKRNKNFEILHQALKHKNELTKIIDKQKINGPMVYPYLNNGNDKLRSELIESKIFVAKYWPNVIDWIDDKGSFEIHLFNNLIPLPIDQRYDIMGMERIIKIIKKNKNL